MRSRKSVVLVASLLACWIMTASASVDQSLEKAVRTMLDGATFDINMLDKEASILVAHGADHRFYTREEIGEVLETAKKAGTKFEVSDFEILHQDTSGQFASITYRVTWKTSVGDKTIATRILSHEIWEHQESQWRRVFAAMDATQQ